MGLVQIDWVDLAAWTSLTGIELEPEEARMIRSLSNTYVVQASLSKEKNCPAPYPNEETPEITGDKVKAQMALIKQRASQRRF